MRSAAACFARTSQMQRGSRMSGNAEDTTSNQSMSSRPASRARTGVLPASEPVSAVREADSFLSSPESSESFDPRGLSLRMFPDCSLPAAEGISESFSQRWTRSGMAFRGECWTVDSSESPRDAVECSLSEVLEPCAPQRFFLSPRAARGILRRAEKRGRTLPSRLQHALEALAQIPADSETPGTPAMPSLGTCGTVAKDQRTTSLSSTGSPTPTEKRNTRGSYWDDGQTADTLDCSMLAKGQMMPEKRRFPCVLQTATTGEAAREETDATTSSHQSPSIQPGERTGSVPTRTKVWQSNAEAEKAETRPRSPQLSLLLTTTEATQQEEDERMMSISSPRSTAEETTAVSEPSRENILSPSTPATTPTEPLRKAKRAARSPEARTEVEECQSLYSVARFRCACGTTTDFRLSPNWEELEDEGWMSIPCPACEIFQMGTVTYLLSPFPKTSAEKSSPAKSATNSPAAAESRDKGIQRLPSTSSAGASTAETTPTKQSEPEPCSTRETQPAEMRREPLLVRRLTPTECETLQGFPKGWTIPSCRKAKTRRATGRSEMR